jgi:hypothetical protein
MENITMFGSAETPEHKVPLIDPPAKITPLPGLGSAGQHARAWRITR